MKATDTISELPDVLLVGGISAASSALPADGETLGPPAGARTRLVDFYELTKPRMNFLVVVTTGVGFYLAEKNTGSSAQPLALGFDWGYWLLLLHTLLGTALTAASAATINQVVERDYDALMQRTRGRPLPAGRIGSSEAMLFGVALGIIGVMELALFVNGLTAVLGAVTLASYVLLYTPLKRRTTLCTVVGAIPGAIPPMMGVTAAAGAITPAAVVLFGILFMWQMPHFLAIAILYRDDYARGGFKMLPVVDENLSATGLQIMLWSLAMLPVTLTPCLFGIAGGLYFAAALAMGIAFLGFAALCAVRRSRPDARQLFLASIIYLPCLLTAMMVDRL